MKLRLLPFLGIAIFAFAAPAAFAADKSKEDYIKDLSSTDVNTVIQAARWLGNEEATEGLEGLFAVATNNESEKARIAAASAIGRLGKMEGRTTNALHSIVSKDKSNHVVYAALLSILNTKDFENETAKKAVDYCDQNKKDDIFIADAVKRLKKAMADN